MNATRSVKSELSGTSQRTVGAIMCIKMSTGLITEITIKPMI